MQQNKTVIGLTVPIRIISNGSSRTLTAKVDTGATKSSIDERLAREIKLGPIIKSKMVRSAHGTKIRPVVEAIVELADRKIPTEFTIADRTHMTYKVLIGVNVLKHNFLIDPSKK